MNMRPIQNIVDPPTSLSLLAKQQLLLRSVMRTRELPIITSEASDNLSSTREITQNAALVSVHVAQILDSTSQSTFGRDSLSSDECAFAILMGYSECQTAAPSSINNFMKLFESKYLKSIQKLRSQAELDLQASQQDKIEIYNATIVEGAKFIAKVIAHQYLSKPTKYVY